MVLSYVWGPDFATPFDRLRLYNILRRCLDENRRIGVSIEWRGEPQILAFASWCTMNFLEIVNNTIVNYSDLIVGITVEVSPSVLDAF